MRMEQLKYIAEIAKTGTISGAAKNLYVSQQAVSSSMKQLEEELGVELLVRGASGVTFTTIGHEVAEFARQTMQQHDLLMNRIRYWQDIRDYEDLNINIASTSCVLNDVVPDVLSRLDYLNTKVTMQVALLNDSREVLEQVHGGKYDIGLITLNEELLQERCAEYGLQMEILARDEAVIVTEQRTVGAEKSRISYDEMELYQQSVFNLEIHPRWAAQLGKGISLSNDINFHRKMMHERDALVTMPNIASKKFFNKSKYKVLLFADDRVEIVHAAVYCADCNPQMKEIISLIRQEIHS
ncbi:MAG: LysR family transcriptional regulator [Peptococcaceae bacterium]|nr:LysR family transcriptional regulator [Peptococcaceae bacterium]MBQ5706674.1 LysR family transcriptional regulator [Peptococcaceae bacterium]